MSCYTQHLDDFLPAAPSPQDKRALDRAVPGAFHAAPGADRPDVWAEVKLRRQVPALGAGVRAESEREV